MAGEEWSSQGSGRRNKVCRRTQRQRPGSFEAPPAVSSDVHETVPQVPGRGPSAGYRIGSGFRASRREEDWDAPIGRYSPCTKPADLPSTRPECTPAIWPTFRDRKRHSC